MQAVVICEKFGWDYHTYMNQPTWFIQLIEDKAEIDYKKKQNEITSTRIHH